MSTKKEKNTTPKKKSPKKSARRNTYRRIQKYSTRTSKSTSPLSKTLPEKMTKDHSSSKSDPSARMLDRKPFLAEKLSFKQMMSVYQATARINIWEGAVRSGKSYASMIRWIEYILLGPKGDLMMIGRSQTTLFRNIVAPLIAFIGADAQYYAGKQQLHLWGRLIYLIGANDETAQFNIQGATLAGAYVDEASVIPRSFFNMLLSRLSVPGAQLFATTNPDSPFHWLKTDFLDRSRELNSEMPNHIISWPFLMEDNPSLDPVYKESLKREYRGLWYQRYIEGKWVLAEGTIYDFFDQSLHCLDLPPTNPKFYIVGIDYGTMNPTAFALIGVNPEIHPQIWLEQEYYWDSRKQNRQKTDAELAQDFKKFILGKPIKAIYIDPSAASLRAELRKVGVDSLFDANNEVRDGISYQSSLIAKGTYKICRGCKKAIEEYGTYRWDEKSIKLGIDKPLKENDHLMDAQRYALYTHFFNKSIKSTSAQELDARWQRFATGSSFGGPFDGPNRR